MKKAFKSLKRKYKEDYPTEAVKEAVINAIVHHDYSQSGSIYVNIFSDRMEILSVGGILSFSLEAIKAGLTQTRNPELMREFCDLKLAYNCGCGICKIFTSYNKYDKKPKIETTKEYFKVILPNIDFGIEENSGLEEDKIEITNNEEKNINNTLKLDNEIEKNTIDEEDKEKMRIIFSLSEIQKEILGVLENGTKSRRELQDILSMSQPKANALLKRLMSLKLIKKIGKGKYISYARV